MNDSIDMAAQKLTPSNKRALAQVTASTLYCEVVIMFTLYMNHRNGLQRRRVIIGTLLVAIGL